MQKAVDGNPSSSSNQTGAMESGPPRIEHRLRSGPVIHSPPCLGRYTVLETTRLQVRDQLQAIFYDANCQSISDTGGAFTKSLPTVPNIDNLFVRHKPRQPSLFCPATY